MQILKSAAAAFRRLGYHGATVEEIAAALHMKKGNLYYYFRNKEEILFACHQYSLDRLHEATGGGHWAELAADARAWFDGRNVAAAPVYDRRRGRVADGIDLGRISENSGAEANIVAAEALFADALEVARDLADPLEPGP